MAKKESKNLTKKSKKKRNPTRKTLVKKLDVIVSKYIRARDKYCVVCGSNERLTNGHVFSRVSYSLRWDIRRNGNCHTQCWGCNYRHEFDPYPYMDWYMNNFGKDKLDQLHINWKQPKKFKNFDLEDLYDEINKKYQELISEDTIFNT